MCGILGTRDPRNLIPVLDALMERGSKYFSLSEINLSIKDPKVENIYIQNYSTEVTKENVLDILSTLPDRKALVVRYLKSKNFIKNDFGNNYWIFHFQSPTATNFCFHPAIEGSTYLWHNGMMEGAELEKRKQNGLLPWDTRILLNMYNESRLDQFMGSFACIFFERGKNPIAFRNKIAPLYFDKEGTICSVKFNGSEKMEPGKFYEIPRDGPVEMIGYFTNDYNPFGV